MQALQLNFLERVKGSKVQRPDGINRSNLTAFIWKARCTKPSVNNWKQKQSEVINAYTL